MNDYADRIRSSGKRLTLQREMILRAVQTLGHATPDEVYAEVRKESSAINLSTVYRNLEVLQELGLVRHTHLSDRTPTYHSAVEREHFHLVCRACGRVSSVEPELLIDLGERLRTDHGFIPDVGHLAVFGTCVDCASAEGQQSAT